MSDAVGSDELEALVVRFAQIDLEACLEEPARLKAAMEERQAILTALQNHDTAQLSEERRAFMKERLRDLIAKNDQFLAKAAQRLEEVRKKMNCLAPGRAAARGYGEFRTPEVSAVRRVG